MKAREIEREIRRTEERERYFSLFALRFDFNPFSILVTELAKKSERNSDMTVKIESKCFRKKVNY